MAWSYRKRIKIAPGIHLNVTKKGVSTSFGVRGASITAGRNGTYLNTGIPGTGIYSGFSFQKVVYFIYNKLIIICLIYFFKIISCLQCNY